MKKMTIRVKITLWFAAALILMAVLTCGMVLSVSRQVIQKTIRDSLIENVENNVDEVKFYQNLDGLETNLDFLNHVDRYMNYASGYLRIDEDFLEQVNGVHTALYTSDQTLIYGENPIAVASQQVSLQNSVIQTVRFDGTLYYIFDRALDRKGVQGLWLRGIVSEKQGDTNLFLISRLSLILMPLLVLLAIVGGYLFAGKILKPIRKISDTARQINNGNDLKQRIELDGGQDELHELADHFNEMFQRLDQAFEAEQQFTSDASHELRTPMSVIMAQCELTLGKEQAPEEYRQAFVLIQRQGKKMTRLINDMLDYTRLEVQPNRYEKTTLNLSSLIASVCTDMALIQEQGIHLEAQIQPDIQVFGNEQLLNRLFSNLVSNAYRYGKENGWIKVTLEQDTAVRLIVADNGIGIRQEDQEKIFHRFYQVDSSRSNQGTGLGLSMVQKIAEYHGGSVNVESIPGKGSIFTFLMLF